MSPSLAQPSTDRGITRAGENRLLVLGLGNDILSDDAIGLLVVRRLEQLVCKSAHVDFRETTEMGLALLDFVAGYEAVFIVDSVQTGNAPPGTLHRFRPDSLGRNGTRPPHFLGVGDTLALGAKLQIPMPCAVRMFGIEVQDPFTLGTRLSPPLENALGSILSEIATEIGVWIATSPK